MIPTPGIIHITGTYYTFLSRFAFGNLWTLGIMWPDYAPTLFEPNQWCHRTLYVFALTQLGVVWGVIALLLLLLLSLIVCQVLLLHDLYSAIHLCKSCMDLTRFAVDEFIKKGLNILTHTDGRCARKVLERKL